MPSTIEIVLTEIEKIELKKAISSRISPVRVVTRAKAILLAGEGIPSYQIAQQLDNFSAHR